MPPALISGSVYGVRVLRIDHDIRNASVLTDVENVLPRLSSVRCFEKSPVAARSPKWSLRSDVNNVGVFWINCDASDVFGSFESDVSPRLATII